MGVNLMNHPLVNVDSELKVDELQTQISDLNKKLNFAYRTNNQALINQLQLALNNVREAYQMKLTEQMSKMKFKGKVRINDEAPTDEADQYTDGALPPLDTGWTPEMIAKSMTRRPS